MKNIFVPTLNYPGTSPSIKNQESQININRLLIGLELTLHDAAIELNLFENAQSALKNLKSEGIVSDSIDSEMCVEEIFPNYHHKVVFIYARAFLCSFDRLKKYIFVLKNEKETKNITQIYEKFISVFTNLSEIRNSSAHIEERIISLGKKKLKIQNAILLEGIEGNKFISSMADGNLGQLEISANSLFFARDCIQEIIYSFDWIGFPKTSP